MSDSVTERIIGCAYKVHNTLGAGFLEKVYENAMCIELKKCGFEITQQCPICVFYDDEQVGDFFADIIVDDEIVVELKAVETLAKKHEVQLVNYLTATKRDIGLLINFGESVEVKRKYRKYYRQD